MSTYFFFGDVQVFLRSRLIEEIYDWWGRCFFNCARFYDFRRFTFSKREKLVISYSFVFCFLVFYLVLCHFSTAFEIRKIDGLPEAKIIFPFLRLSACLNIPFRLLRSCIFENCVCDAEVESRRQFSQLFQCAVYHTRYSRLLLKI